MINKPSVEQLATKIPIRFVIVNAIAKRSREIALGAKVRINTVEKNPLTIAAMEIDSGKVRVVYPPVVAEVELEEQASESEIS